MREQLSPDARGDYPVEKIRVNNTGKLISMQSVTLDALQGLLEQMNLKAPHWSADLDTSTQLYQSASPKPSSNPAFFVPAYQWLLDNLHNPYPSKEVKQWLARNSGVPIRSVDTWFINVRQRIGWTAVSQKFCHGRHADMLEAAHRAYRGGDLSLLPLSEAVLEAFAEIQSIAVKLYLEKLADCDIPPSSTTYQIAKLRESALLTITRYQDSADSQAHERHAPSVYSYQSQGMPKDHGTPLSSQDVNLAGPFDKENDSPVVADYIAQAEGIGATTLQTDKAELSPNVPLHAIPSPHIRKRQSSMSELHVVSKRPRLAFAL
ncbi:uncharacterized protein LAESUDRAFT_752159 [Laetiporus sulphureus 93-53]|uniref:Homeobox domain-containing protein n=1 Tax=Laetiporus sulphureus 93-53 TaxID=1314785 RepID=A0A165CA08_9APHY|nr:uncharacterized protein LAESUDRAFT_752159 [Laetiporus sulphureus 93-53]KZT02449.1 hypothetical protein LAESUDRAFT_752159 [Laetiporus sulphureus 93-53]